MGNCGLGTHIWEGACIQIKSGTAAKSSSKYKLHSNIIFYTDVILTGSASGDLNFHCIYISYGEALHFPEFLPPLFLFCGLWWVFFSPICPILGFLFTSSLEQYFEAESLNMYGNLHLKKPVLCKICNGARHYLYGQSLGNQILAWIIEYSGTLEWTLWIIIQIIHILMHCKLVWKLIYRTDKGHATMEKTETNGHFIHSQREQNCLHNVDCSSEIFKVNISLSNR